jgi:hypothetical protein
MVEALAKVRLASVAHGAALDVNLNKLSRACFEPWNDADV